VRTSLPSLHRDFYSALVATPKANAQVHSCGCRLPDQLQRRYLIPLWVHVTLEIRARQKLARAASVRSRYHPATPFSHFRDVPAQPYPSTPWVDDTVTTSRASTPSLLEPLKPKHGCGL